ncbi:MAG: outer membrane beta-barrel protein [Gammaproteobacteria bacterium]
MVQEAFACTDRPVVRRGVLSALLVTGLWMLPPTARAQYAPNLFPTGVPGYDQELGVTVVSRLHPLYDEPGVRVGGFLVHLNLDESAGYDSNVLGLPGGGGSAIIRTSPSLSVKSDWSRNEFGLSLSANNYRYLSEPAQNRTDWSFAVGGGYTIGRSNLTLSYAHLNLHQGASGIGAPPTTEPVGVTVNDARIAYPFVFGLLTVTPNFEVSLWRYGNAVINGVTEDQSFRDANEYRGGAAFDYALSGSTSVVFTMMAIRSGFLRELPGEPSQSSTSALAMAGIDYQYDGVWRYQAMVGLEARVFDASQFQTEVAPIARGTVIWTPSGLTTFTTTFTRAIEDPTQAGNSGFTYTSIEFRVDHEYERNMLLHARVGGAFTSYLQNGGTQPEFNIGVGSTWLINRRMRLNVGYSYTTRNDFVMGSVDGGLANSVSVSGYDRSLFLVALHFGL